MGETEGKKDEADYKRLQTFPLVRHSDMPEEMRVETMELCVTACEKFSNNNESAAKMIKETMDKKFGSSWHVVIGEGFGFEITHEGGCPLASLEPAAFHPCAAGKCPLSLCPYESGPKKEPVLSRDTGSFLSSGEVVITPPKKPLPSWTPGAQATTSHWTCSPGPALAEDQAVLPSSPPRPRLHDPCMLPPPTAQSQ
ncbi:dynein axonemal light chain 4 isoform 1-T1 [Callospermophilus lateralis]|uniref:dynein axonemal light chain 4 isoform X1 n=1 Tax=Callospermophilus lateralis TaxID=76772 RepID=UPI004053A0E1